MWGATRNFMHYIELFGNFVKDKVCRLKDCTITDGNIERLLIRIHRLITLKIYQNSLKFLLWNIQASPRKTFEIGRCKQSHINRYMYMNVGGIETGRNVSCSAACMCSFVPLPVRFWAADSMESINGLRPMYVSRSGCVSGSLHPQLARST